MPRTRATGFTRFLLFLLIAAPLIFFGVSYARGEDPVGQIKGWLGDDIPERVVESNDDMDCDALRSENARLRREVARLRGE